MPRDISSTAVATILLTSEPPLRRALPLCFRVFFTGSILTEVGGLFRPPSGGRGGREGSQSGAYSILVARQGTPSCVYADH